jgi:hypothetical protein
MQADYTNYEYEAVPDLGRDSGKCRSRANAQSRSEYHLLGESVADRQMVQLNLEDVSFWVRKQTNDALDQSFMPPLIDR